MTCDVSKWSNLEAIPSAVAKAFGKGAVADVWVAGAGIFEPKWSSFVYDQEKEFFIQMRINAEHPIKLTRTAMRSCLGVNKPCVVLIISSGLGIIGTYSAALYSTSKHALVGFTKCMAQADADEDVKVVCICPGMVSTPLWTGEAAKHVNAQFSYTDDMCITPDEVAEAMKEMIEQGRYKGGALLEVSKATPRNVLENPQSSAMKGQQGEELKAWLDRSYAPLREVFAKERGADI